MTPTLQHRQSHGPSRSGTYNAEMTHVRQIKSGLDISDPSTMIKKTFDAAENVVKEGGDNKENNSKDTYGAINILETQHSAQKRVPVTRDRAQTAAKSSAKPPLANQISANVNESVGVTRNDSGQDQILFVDSDQTHLKKQ